MTKKWKQGAFVIKLFRVHIITAIFGVLLFAAVHFFLTAYNQYIDGREKVDALTVRLRLLKQEEKKARQEKKILARVNKFISRADSFGLDKSKWSFYDVHIEEEVSFSELEQILNQCANNSSYYFKPVSFYAKIAGKEDKKNIKPAVSSTNADSDETREGDVQLKLDGAFVVREDRDVGRLGM